MSKANEEKLNSDKCESGCDCDNTAGLSAKGKLIICIVIGLAAAAVLGHSIVKNAEAENTCGPEAGSSCCP